jgi:hypothetical protein
MTPNPGSDEAIKLGCKCPVIENHHGKGVQASDGLRFWYNADCPVHCVKTSGHRDGSV